MVLGSAFVDWLKTFGLGDWLTVAMVVLTGAIFVLTWVMVRMTTAVKRYAAQTLEVTQQSLDLFSTPNVTIDGDQELDGPFGTDNLSGTPMTSPSVLLTVCNNSPLEILIPRSAVRFAILPEESSDRTRARSFSVRSVEPWPGRPPPQGPYVVENALPFKLAVHGPVQKAGEPPLRLVTEFRIDSYLYRGKPGEPLVARCVFVIGPPR